VDVRGHGNSEGLPGDEYTSTDLADGVEVVEWLAADGCRGEGVAVSIDSDDAVDVFCKHGHAVVLLRADGRGRQTSRGNGSP
jgi:predicted acyl esterase